MKEKFTHNIFASTPQSEILTRNFGTAVIVNIWYNMAVNNDYPKVKVLYWSHLQRTVKCALCI